MREATRGWLTLVMVSLFMVLWSITEITEYQERDNFNTEVIKFVSKGDRFTQEEGDLLTKRVEDLENRGKE